MSGSKIRANRIISSFEKNYVSQARAMEDYETELLKINAKIEGISNVRQPRLFGDALVTDQDKYDKNEISIFDEKAVKNLLHKRKAKSIGADGASKSPKRRILKLGTKQSSRPDFEPFLLP